MKNIILIIALGTMTFFTAGAQDKPLTNTGMATNSKITNPFSFSVGLEQGLPIGKVSKYSTYTAGLSIQGEYLALKELGFTLNAGYLYYLSKAGGEGLSFVPVMGGARFYITPKFYLSGQAGISFYAGSESTTGNKKVYLTYAEGIGYQVQKRVDLLLKYEGVNIGVNKDYSFIGMRIAYKFGKVN